MCIATCLSVCLTEDMVLKLPFGRMSSVAAATSAMSLPGFPLEESEEADLSEPQYWSTFKRESITTASGGVPAGSTSGKLWITVIALLHYSVTNTGAKPQFGLSHTHLQNHPCHHHHFEGRSEATQTLLHRHQHIASSTHLRESQLKSKHNGICVRIKETQNRYNQPVAQYKSCNPPQYKNSVWV